ncbi:MAG: PAS domain S-box protein [Opitutaceae bacterium]|nr:PAS domain S-box protein [Opitutaceae bacterium]
MARPLRLLIAEDSPADADLLLRELRAAGFEPRWRRVDSEVDFVAQLNTGIELVLSDFHMPGFDGLRALELLQAHGLEVPFIIVSGTIGEDTAVLAMKQGATDFLMKDRLGRLGPAVEQALESFRLRRQQREAEAERVRAQAQLILLEASVARLNDIVLITEAEPQDEPGPRIVFVNDAFVRRTGYAREEAMGRSPRFLQGPKTSRVELDRMRAAMRHWQPVRVELINYTKQGEEFWVEIDMAPVADATGWFTHWVAIERDITERKRTEEAVRAGEERLRIVTDNARLGLAIVDRERRYTFANPTYARILGLASSDILGRRVADVLPRVYESQIRPRLEQALAGERVAYELSEVNPGDGRHYAVRYEPLVQDGGVRLVVVVITDITEQKKADAALRDSEQTQRQLAEQLEIERSRLVAAQTVAKVGSWETDLAALTVAWSQETFRIFETSPAVFSGTHAGFLEFVHPEDRASFEAAFVKSWGKPGASTVEHRILLPGGRTKFVEERWVVIRDDQGRPIRCMGTCQDISLRKQTENELRSASRQLRALAARVQSVREEERTALAREIHDVLAQELTKLKIDLVWLAKRVGSPSDAATQAAITRRCGEALEQVDASITTVQRIATDLRPVILDSLGLPAAVEWVVEDFARRTGIAGRAQVQRRETALDRDRATAIFRILQESLTNVARYAQASEVVVTFSEEAEAARLTVVDDGVGITRERLEDPRSIGLLGMKERAFAFGGSVEITGVPGAGTTVAVHLPVRPVPEP